MLNRENKIIVQGEFSARDTLKETMEFYNITQTDLATHLSVSQSYISDILKRKKFMSSEFALKVERATGISAELLLRMDLSYQLNSLKVNNQEILQVQPYKWACG
jgi:addiction module HigA family antidote